MPTNGRAGYCTTFEDTQGVHPRTLKLIKQKVSQGTIDELSSENEENFCTEEKQDVLSGSEDAEAPTISKRQKTDSAINLLTAVKLSKRKSKQLAKLLQKGEFLFPLQV